MLIVALFASIVALSCELGVFAAFGGSHRPFTHMPTDTGSLRLVSADAPFGTGPSSNINSERTASDAPRLAPFHDGAIDLPHAWAASPVSPTATFIAPVVHASPQPIEPASPAPDEQASPSGPQQAAGPETAAASTVKAPAAGLPAPPEPKPIASTGRAPNAPPAVASAESTSTAPKTDTAVTPITGAPAAQNPVPTVPVPAPETKPAPNTKEAPAQQAASASTDKARVPADKSAVPATMVVPLQSATVQSTATDVTGSIRASTTPRLTALPNAVDRARPQPVRKPDRKARRRIAAAKRLIRKKTAPTARLFVRQ
jgi:hypothetical protein